VDLNDAGFWTQGLDLLEEMVARAETLAGNAGTEPRRAERLNR
jgi:hypothetical protein